MELIDWKKKRNKASSRLGRKSKGVAGSSVEDAGPVSSRFNRFHQIGTRTFKGSRASGGPFLYYVVQNTTENVK